MVSVKHYLMLKVESVIYRDVSLVSIQVVAFSLMTLLRRKCMYDCMTV